MNAQTSMVEQLLSQLQGAPMQQIASQLGAGDLFKLAGSFLNKR